MSLACSGVYREVARWCGDDVARALHTHYAGQAISVPKKITDDHPLAQRLGRDGAARLSAHFGGAWLDIPLRLLTGKRLRARILELRAMGWRTPEIVREVGCTRRHVAMVLKASRFSGAGQLDLF